MAKGAALVEQKSRFDSGEWMVTVKMQKKTVAKMDPKKINLASRFGGLDIETGNEHQETVVASNNAPTWVQVAKGLNPEAVEEIDEELPPLIWGQVNGARWGG
jgi:hypothetical protein